MIPKSEWRRYQISTTHAVFGDGHRMLTDDDILQEGDETACVSSLLSVEYHEGWCSIIPEWSSSIGKPISEIINEHSLDADHAERLFRRGVK